MSESKPSQICVIIGRTRHKMMQIEIKEAGKRGAELIEVRLDFLAKAPDFKRLLADKACPMVATVRRPQDGGRFSGTEEQRSMLLRQAIVAGFDWVDLETEVADKIPRFGKVKRIISYHNFRSVPEDLEKIYEKMCKQDGDVVKIAVSAQQTTDNFRVMDLLRNAKKPTVAFCMGEIGFPTRVLGACFGQPFTYAAFNKERGIAPGLPSFDEMRKLYRYEQITAETPIYGVIGDPIAHSLSPQIHNLTLAKMNLPGVYLPFRVPREEIDEFFNGVRDWNIRGFSVTLPHKQAAHDLADEHDAHIGRSGSANTLVRAGNGWAAYNTDAPAALDSLIANLPLPEDGSKPTLEGQTVLILGAGGAARAIGHALQRAGALLTITNRTAERANELAEAIGCRTVDWNARNTVLADILINCTSVGMDPNVNQSPIHQSFLKPSLVVFDTVYTPENTLLIKEARHRSCHLITGVDMFVRQAAEQFKLFTGQEAPYELMEKIIRRILSPVSLRDEE